MQTYLIALWGLTNLSLAVLSISKVKKNKEGCNFIWWWAFPSGAFVWEDMLVFGILHALLAFTSILLNNPLLWLISFLIFWVVRSAGETLYFFLQQFIVPKHHPHNISDKLQVLRKLMGNISDQKAFILLQITMQSILVICLIALTYILKFVL